MNGAQGGQLQNVLSISTAANNRYLLHFNTHGSLTQWTAGIRLAMFEHATLQEAYTGSLIAGKGRLLNNIKTIMERSRFAHDDWARVRFGAGTPWRRCWCVISPPDEKEYKSAQKTMKKSSAYDKVRIPKGDIKFYDTRKITKKTRPIATISDLYAAYAIYPQSKPLIEQSTLVKLEGVVTIHTNPETTTEGFVFVMPEVHAAVSGFEMMLQFLFPVFDTFCLYGRPNRLIADTLDQRGLMFAMPRDRRYGYLDILDVSNLIHTQGSQGWTERRWRRELKKLTSDRMMTSMEGGTENSRESSQRRNQSNRTSLPPPRPGVRFGGDEQTAHSTPGSRSASPHQLTGAENRNPGAIRTDSAPAGAVSMSPHKRSVSEAQGYRRYTSETPSRLSHELNRPNEDESPPEPPQHGGMLGVAAGAAAAQRSYTRSPLERIQSEAEVPTVQSTYNEMQMQNASPHLAPPEPVTSPPAFTHSPNSRPSNQPYQAPELRRAHSNVDAATLYQMQDARRRDDTVDSRDGEVMWNGEMQQRQQNTVSSQFQASRSLGAPADRSQGVLNRQDQQRDARQRLSTIPGSPYVGNGSTFVQSPQQYHQRSPMNGMEDERPIATRSETSLPTTGARPPVPLHSSQSIARKPVPRPLPQAPGAGVQSLDTLALSSESRPSMQRSSSDPSSPSSINVEGLEDAVVYSDALEQILNPAERTDTLQSRTTESSEPDYASTAPSTKSGKKSMERPRAGKMKTVGDPDFPVADPRSGGAGKLDTYYQEQATQAAPIPNVDFGPTYAYRPGTSGTLTPGDIADKRRSRSADPLSGSNGTTPNHETPRNSYFGGRNTPSPGRLTPDYAHAYQDQSNVAWQPAPSPGTMHRSKTSITPEQWVQQKAAMAQQPQYVPPRKGIPDRYNTHGRTNSAQGHRKLTKERPLSRTLSGDWAQQYQQKTPSPRPQSRGAGINFDSAGQSLSAVEQMQVSRATGTPLITLAQSASLQQHQNHSGLVGGIAQRERDKATSREGRNSMIVQQAIMDRHQQAVRSEAEAAAQQQYQMQVQAQQQAQTAQAQQMQQQRNWNQMMYVQNQQNQQAQRPVMQTHHSWQG